MEVCAGIQCKKTGRATKVAEGGRGVFRERTIRPLERQRDWINVVCGNIATALWIGIAWMANKRLV